MSDPNSSALEQDSHHLNLNPQPEPPGFEMSTGETLTSIFFEPGRVFEAMRARPRFLVVGLILIALTVLVTVLLFQKVDFTEFMRERLANSPQAAQMTEEQKEKTTRLTKIALQFLPPISLAVIFAAGAGLYLLGVMAMGKSITYKQALAVWVYSSFPPGIITGILSIIMIFIKSADQIDLTRPGGNLLVTNPSALMGEGTSRMLLAALASFDLLKLYGMFLAALGLRKVARLSSGAAWAIVLGIWLLGTLFSVAGAAFGGR